MLFSQAILFLILEYQMIWWKGFLRCFALLLEHWTGSRDCLSEQFSDVQRNVEALPGETVALITELPEPDLEVTWLKDNVALCLPESKCEATNEDCGYQLLIPDVGPEDGGVYRVQGGDFESSVQLTVRGASEAKTKLSNDVLFCILLWVFVLKICVKRKATPDCRATCRAAGQFRDPHWRDVRSDVRVTRTRSRCDLVERQRPSIIGRQQISNCESGLFVSVGYS